MIVVVASRHDEGSRKIVAEWAAQETALLTCEDLSTSGWRHFPFDQPASTCVISGKVVRESDIRGVIVRRPWIFEQELTQIAAADREYVAAEMNAFLQSWLACLPCPVLNRPAGTCLCGPNWRPQQWGLAAEHAGMQVQASHWRVPASRKRTPQVAASDSFQVTVIGDRCVGATDESCAASARRLAANAGTGLLAVRLARGKGAPRFLAANPIPDLEDVEVATAVRDYLLSNVSAKAGPA